MVLRYFRYRLTFGKHTSHPSCSWRWLFLVSWYVQFCVWQPRCNNGGRQRLRHRFSVRQRLRIELRIENSESPAAAAESEAEAVAAPLAILVFTSSLASHNKSHKPNQTTRTRGVAVALAVAATKKLQRQKCTHTTASGEPTERHSHRYVCISGQAKSSAKNSSERKSEGREPQLDKQQNLHNKANSEKTCSPNDTHKQTDCSLSLSLSGSLLLGLWKIAKKITRESNLVACGNQVFIFFNIELHQTINSKAKTRQTKVKIPYK